VGLVTDREFWLEIRRAAMIVLAAIDKRYSLGKKTT
jgi:hypothetical protein